MNADLQAAALDGARRIADELLICIERDTAVGWPGNDWTLASGGAGGALLFHYVNLVSPSSEYDASSDWCIARAAEALASQRLSSTLFWGYPGIAWTIAHLARRREAAAQYCLAAIDDVVLRCLDDPRGGQDYDLVAGHVGLGVYALERLPGEQAFEIVQRVVKRLALAADATEHGVAWRTVDVSASTPGADPSPDRRYNVGVAHGVAGAIAFLARVLRLGLDVQDARELLDGAVAWLLAQRMSAQESVWPSIVSRAIPPHASPTAWCYGDPGVATCLVQASLARDNPEWLRHGVAAAVAASGRPLARGHVHDASLCHGSAGLMHLYARLAWTTDDSRLWDATARMVRTTLDFARFATGVAGYQRCRRLTHAGPEYVPDCSLLNGAVGIGLALIGVGSTVDPAWDGVLLSNLA